MEIMARKTFKFRLYPSRQQQEKLTATLEVCRELYNAALQERIGAWKNRTPVGVFDQINQLPDIKQIRPDVAGVFSQVLQDTLRRLNKTYKAFFSRVQRGQKAGFPRFKGRYRYHSFTYPQSGFELSGKLQLSKIGNIKMKQHCPIVGEKPLPSGREYFTLGRALSPFSRCRCCSSFRMNRRTALGRWRRPSYWRSRTGSNLLPS